MQALTKEQAIFHLWEQGKLEYKLKAHQRRMYKAFHESAERKYVFHCSRRIGKSFTLLVLATEVALQTPGAQIRYAAPTQKNVKEIILPNMREILRDCPEDLRPDWRAQDGHFVFRNGSVISIAGTDGGHADKLRGSACDLALVDEAGFVDELRYVVRSILMPQLLTTNGRLVLSSSSPISPAHDFNAFLMEAEAAGAYMRLTIHDDSRPEVKARIDEWCTESGGEQSTDWRREYLCEILTDQTLAIVPEFTVEKERELVQEVTRPPYFDAYAAMDVGFNDLTAVLFAYWDFSLAKLVIEDELALNRMTTKQLADAIKLKEASLWAKPPLIRVSDTDLIVIHDLQELHNLGFVPTNKDDKEAAINVVRLWIAQNKVLIHPRCTQLRSHLRYGVWNKQRTQFDRAEGFGHYDFVDALVYLVRNIRRHKNPYPHLLGVSEYTHHIPEELKESPAARTVRDAFGF